MGCFILHGFLFEMPYEKGKLIPYEINPELT